MEKYLIKRPRPGSSPPKRNDPPKQMLEPSPSSNPLDDPIEEACIELNLNDLIGDPGLRKKISSYHPNNQDKVRRAYWLRGPTQPRNIEFPATYFGVKPRRFVDSWYDEPNSYWLEYSEAKDAVYCLCCYLFKSNIGQQSGGDSFVCDGFRNWKKREKLNEHVGRLNSSHHQAWRKCKDLMRQDQHISTVFFKQSSQSRSEYKKRLIASIDCIRFLLRQGLPLRGCDESDDSENRGNFLELLEFLADHNEEVNSVVLKNAPQNLKLTSPDIQRDIVNVIAVETLNAIITDIGDECFSILVDESRDVSTKEQMAIALRYVNREGHVVESFLGIKHVKNTTASSLKEAIDATLSKHGLSISKCRGQGYDGASNMNGEFNGLKTLILRENESAYYIHYFAHQLQLALVAVAKNHSDISWFFNSISSIINIVGGSSKRHDALLEAQAIHVFKTILDGEVTTGRGLNQETGLARASDTRWGSHYATLMSLISMFSAVISVLESVRDDGTGDQKGIARGLLFLMHQFDFIFNLHLMRQVLSITSDLSQALQRKDQDIVNAMMLVKLSKNRLQLMRNGEWDGFLQQVKLFCNSHEVVVPSMEELYLIAGRSRRKSEITNLHHYQVELFYTVIDMQLQELNDRFSEATTELLVCVACLSPVHSFSAFDKQKLIQLASFYPNDFSLFESMALGDELDAYIFDMLNSGEFSELKSLAELAQNLICKKRNAIYPSVYRLLKFALILPVATATVERAFSAMKIVKNRLRNRMGDQLLNDSLVVYIEKKKLDELTDEDIVQRFQNMKTRREQL